VIDYNKFSEKDVSWREKKLSELLKDMDVPETRTNMSTLKNLRWLSRNMYAENAKHASYPEAQELMIWLLRFHTQSRPKKQRRRNTNA